MDPKSISLSQEPKGIVIEWTDGQKGTYPFSLLRRSCPCALCKGEKIPFAPDPLILPSFPNLPSAALEVKEMFKVGNYAIGFRWGDGHDTGIYTFEYLRRLIEK
ncbi:MAG: DUF971 domain-containing protein [Deltaproteobacteria bacterium]|nr:DUF971 domain-containing protein [Deltaproteobacteria bacterium]